MSYPQPVSSSPGWSDQGWLGPDERVLWQGAPDAARILSNQDLLLIPFSVLWGGFAIFWEIGVSRSGWGFGTVWGVPFGCVGLYLIFGRFFYKRWDRRRTRYVLTNRRAVLIRNNGRTFKDTPVEGAPVNIEWSRDHRHGTVSWPNSEQRDPRQTRNWLSGRTPGFTFLAGTGWPGAGQSTGVVFADVDGFDRLLAVLNGLRWTGGAARSIEASPDSAWLVPGTAAPAPAFLRREPISWAKFRLPALLFVLGVATLAVVTSVSIHRVSAYADDPPSMGVPGVTVVPLDPGTYVLYEHPTSNTVPSWCPKPQCITFAASDVTVNHTTITGQLGVAIPVVRDVTVDRMTQNDVTYDAAVDVIVSRAGMYEITVRTDQPARVLIDVSQRQELRAFAGWIALGILAIVLAALGLILAIRTARRQRSLP